MRSRGKAVEAVWGKMWAFSTPYERNLPLKAARGEGAILDRCSRVSQPWNIPWLLQEQAARISKALALLSPKRAPLTSGHLDRPMAEVVPTLHATGVDREEENTRWKVAEGLVSGRQDYRLLITCVCPANYPGHPGAFAV